MAKIDWSKQIILLTGGTGSFGTKFTEIMLEKYNPKAIRIFSRDELKQWEMDKHFNSDKRLRYFLGDVRDKDRVQKAMDGVDVVIHAAALKHVPLCEYNPFEAVKTNILGAQNIIEAAIDQNVKRVLAISTDKAVNPVNLYGATKMCMEKIFISGNSYVGTRDIAMSCVRYGNVFGSRGSLITVLKDQRKTGTITITDDRMTRFWLLVDDGVEFVINCLGQMNGGEVFVPKIPSMKVTDLAKTIAPECETKIIGIRPGEKLHECLLTEDEARHAFEFDKFFVIEPEHPWWMRDQLKGGKPLEEGFKYTSDNNEECLTPDDIRRMVNL